MTNGSALVLTENGRDARLTWAIGGGLLVAYAALPLLFLRGIPVPGLTYVTDAFWAVSLLLFAFGIRGSGSVVAGRAGGVAALIVAAAVPLATRWAMQLGTMTTIPPGSGPNPMPPNPPGNLPVVAPFDDFTSGAASTIAAIVGQVGGILLLVTPLVAAFMIGRAGALPRRVRWMPLIVVACGPASVLLGQLLFVAQSRRNLDAIVWVFDAGSMLTTLGYLVLGILATAFASRASALLGETAPTAARR
jgi:hypothetical protein